MNNLYNKIYNAINEGVQKALIVKNDQSDDISVGWSEKEISSQFAQIEYQTVDLGLPSGLLWCKYNIGAFPGNKPEDWYGNYYTWGGLKKIIESKTSYTYANNDPFYNYMNNVYTKYHKHDNKNMLDGEDDIVSYTLGDQFRMPTDEEYCELIKYAEQKLVNNYNNVYGLNGILFISKINSKSLFIPASGYYDMQSPYESGQYGAVWTAVNNSNDPNNAYHLYFNSDDIKIGGSDRYIGFAVRSVQIK